MTALSLVVFGVYVRLSLSIGHLVVYRFYLKMFQIKAIVRAFDHNGGENPEVRRQSGFSRV